MEGVYCAARDMSPSLSLRPLGRAACAFVVALLFACDHGGERGPRRQPIFDLVTRLPGAEVAQEPTVLDLGTPQAHPHLGGGWSRSELDRSLERTFVWATGEASEVVFHLLAPRDLTLRLEGRPFLFPDAPSQQVDVEINGHGVGSFVMTPTLEVNSVTLPAANLVVGSNLLTLRYRYGRKPLEVVEGSRDRRSLAVAWYRLAFGDEIAAAAPPAVGADPVRGLLFLPYGSEVRYTLPLPAGSGLAVEQWAFRGTAEGRLEVLLEGEQAEAADRGPRGVATVEAADPPSFLPLGGDQSRLVQLTLRALAPEGTAAGGVALVHPTVQAPVGEPTPVAATMPPAATTPSTRPPNIIFYLIDTLRADHLGCYGYERPVSPHIDAFAAEAVLFEHMVAQSSWTRSSVASIFTGLWPRAHGTNLRHERLSATAQVLPEILSAAGYGTSGWSTNPNVSPTFGFEQGFDTFRYLGEATGADEVNRAALAWLDVQPRERPFFLYLHTIEPHSPYMPPTPCRRRFAADVPMEMGLQSRVNDLQAGRWPASETALAQVRALYDAEINCNDQSFGALVDALQERVLYEDAWIILVSDHGEEFHEHGNFQHGRALHTESIDVPLIIKPPGHRAGRRVAARVQQVDLLPTLLAAASLPISPGLEGRSLLPLLVEAAPPPAPTPIFSYLHLDGPARVSVQEGSWKLIQRIDGETLIWPRLYHLEDDPEEEHNLAERYPIRTAYLASLLRQKLATGTFLPAEEAAIDEELRRSLEALGYVQ